MVRCVPTVRPLRIDRKRQKPLIKPSQFHCETASQTHRRPALFAHTRRISLVTQSFFETQCTIRPAKLRLAILATLPNPLKPLHLHATDFETCSRNGSQERAAIRSAGRTEHREGEGGGGSIRLARVDAAERAARARLSRNA
jgi:hypothetical protein